MVGGWVVLAVVVVAGTQACNAIWAFANPAPHHWDNADYLDQAYADSWAYRFGGPEYDPEHHPGVRRFGWVGVWDSILHRDVQRPPGYRVVSLPFVYLQTAVLPTLRAVSLAVFWATLYVIYRTGRAALPGPVGVAAGALSAALVAVYLEVGWSVRVYGTEYTLYLAVAAMLLCVARATRPAGLTHGTWVGLGLALGLGVLSKLSFLMLAAPVGALAGVLVLTGRLPGLTMRRLVGAAGVGAAIDYPYYRYHIWSVVNYGRAMTRFARHSLGQRGVALVHDWLSLHCNEGMGPRAFFLLVGIGGVSAGVLIVRAATPVFGGGRQGRPPSVEPARPYGPPLKGEVAPALWTAAFGIVAGVPLLVYQLTASVSDNVRHMTPAYLPITVAVVVAAGAAGVLASWWSWPVLAAAAVTLPVQVARDFFPLTTTADDVWDWEELYRIVHDDRHLPLPLVGRVGNYGQFNEPAVVAPWYRRGDWADCRWLWRAEFGPFDWAAVERELDDPKFPLAVVVTVLGVEVPKDASRLAEPVAVDNGHNAAFADHMAREPGWVPAGRFPIGVVHRGEVVVFVRSGSGPSP